MARITKRQVDDAERAWARAVERSINPSVDMAVDRARQRFKDLERAYNEQQARGK